MHIACYGQSTPQIDVDSDEDVCSFVDKYISGRRPSSTDNPDNDDVHELVKRLETHSHSAYCRRKGLSRFGFPKVPSPSTLISRQPEDDINAQEILNLHKKFWLKFMRHWKVIKILLGKNFSRRQMLQKINTQKA